MNTSSINLDSFQDNNVSALIYTILESLKAGENIELLVHDEPLHILEKLDRSELPDFDFYADRADETNWKIVIKKRKVLESNSVGCCGMCGGEDKHKR